MVRVKLSRGLNERHVRYVLAVFFLALAVPAVVLIAQAYGQLKWEAFRRTQSSAEDLAARIDADLRSVVAAEEARSFSDYAFLVVEGDAAANFVQRSALSAFPVESAVPGVLGYFQVNAEGELTTPLLPERGVDPQIYGISADERGARLALEATIRNVLVENRLVQRSILDEAATLESRALPDEAAPREERLQFAERAADLSAPADGAGVAPPPGRAPAIPRSPVPGGVGAGPAADGDSAGAPRARAAGADDAPAQVLQAQAGFDRLNAVTASAVPRQTATDQTGPVLRRVDELKLEAPYARRAEEASPSAGDTIRLEARQKRTEQTLVPEPQPAAAAERESSSAASPEFRVRMFESELDPFEVGLLDTGHMVMFRNGWRDGQRYIQGAVIDRERFVARGVESAFAASSLAGISDLIVAYGGSVLGALGAGASSGYSSGELAGSVLYRARLSPPFGDLELIFSVNQLPRAAGSVLLGWVTVTLATVLCGGFFLMYRFAAGQIRLARQQQDFVSAVSHELKTPLTSIRMYGEMLKAGWADDAKKQTYYDYIHGESERLSRLIDNVLQLARFTRNAPQLDMKRVTVAELMDIVRSKVSTQAERAGFRIDVRNDAAADVDVLIDPDCFTQVVINLVDNALKFSAAAERKAVEIACRRERDGRVLFTVRDFGPGIPKGQMKKIFDLFYRPANELTRETVGTGIGLALVQQLVTAMGGRVEVRNCAPGAEFRLSFGSSGGH
jgi:signal transduction histidine kinase